MRDSPLASNISSSFEPVIVVHESWSSSLSLPVAIGVGLLVGLIAGAVTGGYFYLIVKLIRKFLPKKTTPRQLIVSYVGLTLNTLAFELNFLTWLLFGASIGSPIITLVIFHAYIFFAAMTGNKEYLIRTRFWNSLGCARELALFVLFAFTGIAIVQLEFHVSYLLALVIMYHVLVYFFVRMTWLIVRADELEICTNYKNKVGVMKRQGTEWVEVMDEEPKSEFTVVVDNQLTSSEEKKPIDNYY